MTLTLTLKLIILAIIFIITGGALFSEFFQKHKFMLFLASLMTIISSYFLLKEIISIFEDDTNPTGEVLNIKRSYYEGDEVVYSIKASDNKALSTITFSIEDTTVKETRNVSGKEISKQSSFSTEGWQTQNYKYILTIVDKGGNTFEQEGNFSVDKPKTNPACVLFNECS